MPLLSSLSPIMCATSTWYRAGNAKRTLTMTTNDLKHVSRERLNSIIWDNHSLAQNPDCNYLFDTQQRLDEATRERQRRGKPL